MMSKRLGRDDVIFASNTSSLPITQDRGGQQAPRNRDRDALLLAGPQNAAARDHRHRSDGRLGHRDLRRAR